jgi:hypothetical protein
MEVMLCYQSLEYEIFPAGEGVVMRSLKPLLLGVIIGVVLGLWFGVNIGKQKPFYGNPFAERSVGEKIKTTIGESVGKAGEKLEKLGQDLQGTKKP